MKQKNSKLKDIVILTTLIMILSLLPISSAASVTPVLVDPWSSGDADVECNQISSGADYAYKIDDWDQTNGMDGTYTHTGNTITISNSDGKTFDWDSDYPVIAVIVVAANKANVYWYYGAYSDTDLVAPEAKEISHATFCFDEGEPLTGSISGYKWNDLDMDGVWDTGEQALPGWSIKLYGEDDLTPQETKVTDSNGYYEFTDLTAETYRVYEELQNGWTQSYPVIGHHEIPLSSGENSQDNNFGNYETPSQPEKGTIIIEKKVDLGVSTEYINSILFEFIGDISGWIGDGEQLTLVDVTPGTYVVTEKNMGWTTSIEIDDPDGGSTYDGVTTSIDLDDGETVKVTYTNRPPDFVIPETPLGTISSVIAMLGAAILLRNKIIPIK